ncbi:baseplate J/gp47 family protein [Serratia fonticola]|uniref:baseplate J/gp47 family protein n=1 Tax=Serratia fonticola TaxID=47917 RepID=UPI003AAAFAA9
MPHFTPDVASIRDALLRDIRNQLPDANVGEDSDYFIRAASVASVAEGIYQDQGWIVRQIFPDTADTEYLELHCRTRNITRKTANTASGPVSLTGEPNARVPAGLTITRDGASWSTTEAITLGNDGNGTVTARASVAGAIGNTTAVMSGMLATTPNGIDSAVLIGVMSGGTNQESDSELLARLLELIRRPPAGGNKYDYKRWALEVVGVSSAYVYPLRRGLGTVDVVITSADGLPSADVIERTQAHIDDVRPVTAKSSLVLAPTIKTFDIDVKVELNGLNIEEATTQVKAALADFDGRLVPGATFIRSQAGTQISLIAGIVDQDIVNPPGNVVPAVDADNIEWLRVGEITVGLL